MEVDSDLEVVTIPEPAGTFLYRCNFGVQSLRHGVSDAMFEIGQHIRQMPGNHNAASIMAAGAVLVTNNPRHYEHVAAPLSLVN